MKPLNRFAESLSISNHIKTAFCGDFLTVFRNKANKVWRCLQGDFYDLRRIADLQIQLGVNVLAYGKDVGVLNVAPIFAEVNRDRVRASFFCLVRCQEQIGLGIRRVWHQGVAGLSQGRDMINVYSKLELS